MPCPYCDENAAEFIKTKRPLPMQGYERATLSVVRCLSCDLYYSTPLPDRFDEVLEAFFAEKWESDYRNPVMDEWVSATWRHEPFWMPTARRLKRLIASPQLSVSRAGEVMKVVLDNKPKTLLDIGCSYGGFVRSARQAGVEAYGIDPHTDLVRRLKAHGVKGVEAGLFGRNFGPLSHYDAITLISVMDHFPYITKKMFIDCANKLNPDGRLIICDVNPVEVLHDNTLTSPISFSYVTPTFMARVAKDSGLKYANTLCKSEPMYVSHTLKKPS